MLYIQYYKSPFGDMTMMGTEKKLTGLWFNDQKNVGRNPNEECIEELTPVFYDTFNWLDIYFDGKCPGFVPDYKLSGTVFRLRVWELLKTIPYGKTMTYGQLASKLCKTDTGIGIYARAVGGAASQNPICLIIPCHRVIGANGSLTGYNGGIERKRMLLELEKTVY